MVKISLNLIDRCFREEGARRVSKKAKIALKEYLEKELKRVCKEAIGMAKKDKTKTVMSRHVEEAIAQKTLL